MNATAAPTDERMLDLLEKMVGYATQSDDKAWEKGDLPWDLPAVPYLDRPRLIPIIGSAIGQQYQADVLAVKMAAQILEGVKEPEAQQYYRYLRREEELHTSVWTVLLEMTGGLNERDPYLDELVRIVLEADTLEEKVFLMQVFFEAAIIPRFQLIADTCQRSCPGELLPSGRRASGTVLEALCRQLKIDDGRHHGSGVTYLEYLLLQAPPRVRRQVVHTAVDFALPVFTQHAFWRPKARSIANSAMWETDAKWVTNEVARGVKIGIRLGLPFGNFGIELPRP